MMTMMTEIVTGDRYDPRYSSEDRVHRLQTHLEHALKNHVFKVPGLDLKQLRVILEDDQFIIHATISYSEVVDVDTETVPPLLHLSWLIDQIVQDHNRWEHDGVRWISQYSWKLELPT